MRVFAERVYFIIQKAGYGGEFCRDSSEASLGDYAAYFLLRLNYTKWLLHRMEYREQQSRRRRGANGKKWAANATVLAKR